MRLIPPLLLLLLLAACASRVDTPSPVLTPKPFPNTPEGRGAALFAGKGRCATCHALSPDTVIVGPSLAGIASRAATRLENRTAEQYIEESILNPDAYRPPGFENQQMDTSLAKLLTVDEVGDLVAYLMTLE